MMKNICSHNDCTNEIYKNAECILHCEKNEFDDNDVELFWNTLQSTFSIPYIAHLNEVRSKVLIQSICFPKFQGNDGRRRALNFSNTDGRFEYDVTFEKCTFTEDFDLRNNSFAESLIFKDCIFYGDILCRNINKLIVEDCKFNNEFMLKQTKCQNLIIDTTTFNKFVDIQVLNTLLIDKNSIFKEQVTFTGANSLDIDCKNSKFIEYIVISKAKNVKFFELESKSNIDFRENLEKLEIIDCSTGILELNNIKEFLLDNLISPKLTSIGEKCKNVLIENSNIDEIDLNAINYEKITIHKNTQSKEMKISDSTNVIIADSTLNEIKMLGKNYTSLSMKNTNISNLFEANSIKDILFDNIKMNPKVLLHENNYPKIVFKDSFLDSLTISPQMLIDDTIQNSNNNIVIENIEIKHEFNLSKVHTLSMLKSHFNGLFKVKSCVNIKIDDCNFKDMLYLKNGDFKNIEIEKITCEKEVSFESAIINTLKIKGTTSEYCQFLSSVAFSNANINKLSINQSKFVNEVNFSDIEGIDLSSISHTVIEKMTICKTNVKNIFYSSKSLIINKLLLDSVKLNSDFSDNQINVTKVKIQEFKCNKLSILGDLNFDEMKIDNFTIANSNIEKIFRIKYSQIQDTFFTDTTFEDLQIIDNKNDNFKEKREFRLKNTTIKSTVLDKLKLDTFNMKDAHVSDAKIGFVKFEQGSRETNRFFKNYYDSISDYITADKYYRDEMQEQFKVSKGSEWLILLCNKGISNFGQSWLRPIGWIFGLGILFYFFSHFKLLTNETYLFNHKLIIWNGFWEFMNPFSKKVTDEYKNFYGFWMIHKLLTTALIYHFIVAVKRRTKR